MVDGLEKYFTIRYEDNIVKMLDQRYLPHQTRYLSCSDYHQVATAISQMVIRGAPAIGAAAAYGMALAAYRSNAQNHLDLMADLDKAASVLIASRPTAVNLTWAVKRIMDRVKSLPSHNVSETTRIILEEANSLAQEDEQNCQLMGQNGASLIPVNANIIHHCNTGALATVAYGTALGVIRAAHEQGKHIHVFVDETRPRLQGARLTAWELQQLGIPYTIIVDSASGLLMQHGKVHLCIVGCDRVASNGDVANKIGTYNLAMAAHVHHIPFYVAGPSSSFDMDARDGTAIVVEERPDEEITQIGGVRITPEGAEVYNPAFDITPAKYITAFITEKGVIYPPFGEHFHGIITH
jgi:methylthioribose-1-phosphate isomerase